MMTVECGCSHTTTCSLTHRCCLNLSTGLLRNFYLIYFLRHLILVNQQISLMSNKSNAFYESLKNRIHFKQVFAQKATWQHRQKHS